MRKLTRRSALGGLSGAGLVSLLGTLPRIANAGEKEPQRREFFVIGPYYLGDWFRKDNLRLLRLFHQGAPNPDEIVKSLRECTLFIIDERVWKDPKKVRFADGGPKLVATGKLHHVWENNKKTFTIKIRDLKAAQDLIDYVSEPPRKRVGLSVEMTVDSTSPEGNTSSIFSIISPEDYFYDINGKLRHKNE